MLKKIILLIFILSFASESFAKEKQCLKSFSVDETRVKLIPKHLKKYLDKTYIFDGPNCFNATFMWFNKNSKVSYPFYMSAKSMENYLVNNFEELDSPTPKYGDVISFWSKGFFYKGSLVHTAVYLKHGKVWHKMDASEASPWTIEDLSNVKKVYGNNLIYHRIIPN